MDDSSQYRCTVTGTPLKATLLWFKNKKPVMFCNGQVSTTAESDGVGISLAEGTTEGKMPKNEQQRKT